MHNIFYTKGEHSEKIRTDTTGGIDRFSTCR